MKRKSPKTNKPDIFNLLKNMPIEQLNQLQEYLSTMPKDDFITKVLQNMINVGMDKERAKYLEEHFSSDNKANGHYNRTVAYGTKNLELKAPRDRLSEFRSIFLPERYSRSYEQSYEDIINSLLVNGFSKNQLSKTLESLNIPYTKETIDEIATEISNEAKAFKDRPLDSDYYALYIDGYVCEIKDDDTASKFVVYSVIGIDTNNKKDLVGYYVIKGSESKDNWKDVFNDLVSRGIKRVAVIVSDDLAGFTDVIHTFFPKAKHQLCIVHLMRNLRKNLPKSIANSIITSIQDIKSLNSSSVATDKFIDVIKSELSDKRYSKYLDYLLQRAEHYFAFVDFPKSVRSSFSSTNVVESFNSMIEKIRIRSGGFFQSLNYLDVNMHLLRRSLVDKKWKKPAPKLQDKAYEINQLFTLLYS